MMVYTNRMNRIYKLKTHCIRGHEYTTDNTAIRKRGRQCRACDRDNKRKYYRQNHPTVIRRQPGEVPHGTVTKYANHKCRCRKCIDAATSYRRERLKINPQIAINKKAYSKIYYYKYKIRISETKKIWRKNNPDREFASKMKKYGMTPTLYDEMFLSQGNSCGACSTTQPTHKHRFGIDHNHDTGEVRGILCGKCNSALGLLDDSVEKVKGLLMYIQKEGVK